MATRAGSGEYDELREVFADLTGHEIVELIDHVSSQREGRAFAAIIAGLSDAAVRLLAVRLLVGLGEDPDDSAGPLAACKRRRVCR